MKAIKLILFVIILSVSVSSCHKGGPWGIKGKGANVTETRSLSGFDKLDLSIDAEVFYTRDSVFRVEITAQPNILAVLKAEVKNNTLQFDYKRNVWDHNDVKITVHSPNMKELNISGSGDITAQNGLNADKMEINVSDSGDIYLPSLTAKTLKATISGSGDVKIAGGTVKDETFTISGSGDVETEELIAETATVKISGSGEITVHATEKLNATISGSGDVRYKGSPVININTSGSGKLIHID